MERSDESAFQALFTVSKKVGKEAMNIYYGDNNFSSTFQATWSTLEVQPQAFTMREGRQASQDTKQQR